MANPLLAGRYQLGEVIGRGDYDMFVWGWTPYVDPDTQLGYFTCDQIASDPDEFNTAATPNQSSRSTRFHRGGTSLRCEFHELRPCN